MMDWHCLAHIKQVLIIAHLGCQHKCPEGLFLTQSYFMTSEDIKYCAQVIYSRLFLYLFTVLQLTAV